MIRLYSSWTIAILIPKIIASTDTASIAICTDGKYPNILINTKPMDIQPITENDCNNTDPLGKPLL